MKLRFAKTGRACVAFLALAACIASVGGCSSNRELSDSLAGFQTDSNLSEQDSGSASESSSGSGDGSLIASTGDDGYALWSKGRFSVSDSDGEDLLFEIDPAVTRTRLWTSLEVDGNAIVAGRLRAESIATEGSLVAGSIASSSGNVMQLISDLVDAGSVSADFISASSLASSEVSANSVDSSSVSASSISAGELDVMESYFESVATKALDATAIKGTTLDIASFQAASASVGNAVAEAASIGTVSAEDISAVSIIASDAIGASSIAAADGGFDELTSSSASMAELAAGNLEAEYGAFWRLAADVLDAGCVFAADVEADDGIFDGLEADEATIEALSAGSIDATGSIAADSAEAGSLSADTLDADSIDVGSAEVWTLVAKSVECASFEAESVDAGSVTADSIQGTLDGLSVGVSSAGIATFAAVDSDGDGLDGSVIISADSDADALLVTPVSYGDEFQCTYEVADLGDGAWRIDRKLPESVWESLEDGTFEGLGERCVYWLAIDFG